MVSLDELVAITVEEFDRVRALEVTPAEICSLFADMCRVNTLYMISYAGSGHVGSSLSAMDIVCHLYLDRMQGAGDEDKGDVYFSSKGHDVPGLYNVLIAQGLLPYEKIDQLRRIGGLPGHPDLHTPHIVTNTGSLGMGIAKARGMATADNLNGDTRHYYVLLGDGELQEGQFWESLQPTANRKLGNITAIVDHNKLQSDTFVSEVSDLGDLEERVRVHGWEVARCDGHDIVALAATLDTLQKVTDKPKLLIADTIKAKGGARMEATHFTASDRLYPFHSGAPAPDYYVEAVNALLVSLNERLAGFGAAALKVSTRKRPSVGAGAAAAEQGATPHKLIGAYADALVKAGAENEKLVALSADLALDCGLIPFEEKYPDRFIECGIAEMDMVSSAGGMANKGLLPFVHSFACFLPHRANEQIFNNATEESKVVYVGSLAGIVPGGPGHSHQMVRDIAALGGVPGMTMIEPSCEKEVGMAVDWLATEATGPSYMRLVSIPVEIPYTLPEQYQLTPGQGCLLADHGSQVVIIGYGPVMLAEGFMAAATLAEKGIGCKVYNLPWLNLIDEDWLAEIIGDAELLLTLDNHTLEGGQGEKIAATLAGTNIYVKNIGVDRIPECGRNDEVLAAHKMDAASLVTAISDALA